MNVIATPQPKLDVRDVRKAYGKLSVLEGCTFAVAPDEIVSVVGPSGCGKTTLLWSMSGLHHVTGGGILLDGRLITEPHPDIGLVFQEANLLPWRRLDANILFPFEIRGERPDQGWIDHLLDRVGLADSSGPSRASCRAGCSSARRSCGRCRFAPRCC